MYAIIAHSGKQFHVKPGLKFNVEKIAHAVGDEVKLDDVLIMHDGKAVQVGTPHVDGAAVLVRVIEHGLGDKLRIIKFKRRKHHLKRQGHRQAFTRLEVLAIGDKKTLKAPVAKAEKKLNEEDKVKKAAPASAKKAPVEKKAGEKAKAKVTAAKADKKAVASKSDK